MTNTDKPWNLVEAYAGDSQNVFVAAPYIKRETLGRLLGLVNRDAKLICVSRWRRREIASGVSDRECRELVVEQWRRIPAPPVFACEVLSFWKCGADRVGES